MKCRKCKHWLLSAPAPGLLPAAVWRHLDVCSACALLRRRLLRLERAVRRQPLRPARPERMAQLQELLNRTPQQLPTQQKPGPLSSRPVLYRVIASVFAASLLLGLGWLLGRQSASLSEERPGHIENPALVRKPGDDEKHHARLTAERATLFKLIAHNVHLAQVAPPHDPLETLTRMAEDLRAEAFWLARHHAFEEVPQVVLLYDQVVRHGLAYRAALAAREHRAAVLAALVQQLQRTQTELASLEGKTLPIIAEMLQPLTVAARESASLLRLESNIGKQPPALAPALPPQSLRSRLVLQGLRLANEQDPLRRADLCADLSVQLAYNIVLQAADGDAHRAGEMGTRLDELMTLGVAENLHHAEHNDTKGALAAQVASVRKQAALATAILERNLQDAPPLAQKGLQRALEVSTKGREWAAQVGKAKGHSGQHGPPWLRDGSTERHEPKGKGKGKQGVPPGLQME